ncbi:rapid alkalinization factor [Striga asiatica]|uniref:Rapid alkalinization factor n=1 Tax=Striga asiatica TaxID=4170 RepID=A0A5A7RA01_STRAF|nr:rapid alkalinization factor [Striga asiatica]
MDTTNTLFIILIIIAFTHVMIINHHHNTAAAATFNSSRPTPLPPCKGSIAECDRDLEVLMESETSRRFLTQRKYITPGTLKRDQPVCNGGAPGQPYTNGGGQCVPSSSNPYHRGCPPYYRCRDDS